MTSFDDDDEVVVVGERLPRLESVAPLDGLNVAVTWEGDIRSKAREIVDLAPAIHRYKIYAPLRDDCELFRTVHLQQHRFGIAWGQDDLDMGASTIADLADETMTAEDFSDFMERNGLTLDGVAAELGISRRMAAYYRRERRVPRTMALACRYIDIKTQGAAQTGINRPATIAMMSAGTASGLYGSVDPHGGNEAVSRRAPLERVRTFGSEAVKSADRSADDPPPPRRRKGKAS